MGTELIRVAIIEDHPIFRHGLSEVIESAHAMDLVATASSTEEFESLVPTFVDVILLDLHLPGVEGAEAVRRLSTRCTSVLVLSAAGSPELVLDAMGAGARGYLTKHAERTQILAAITTVASGDNTYFSPILASYYLQAASDERPSETVILTKKEMAVLTCVAQDDADKDIAKTLGISVRTVHSRLNRIRAKTGLRKRASLARLAREGIVDAADDGTVHITRSVAQATAPRAFGETDPAE